MFHKIYPLLEGNGGTHDGRIVVVMSKIIKMRDLFLSEFGAHMKKIALYLVK